MTTPSPLRIDIVSDVVCPWCIVGYRQLRQALDETGVAAEIVWQPFELNPQMPPEGQNLGEHIAEKYGSSPEDSARNRAHLTALGAELGFDFAFDAGSRIVNTFAAHRLLHWAEPVGKQMALKLALFEAYFTQGKDVSQAPVLADIAASVGLDRAGALAMIEDGRFADDVRQAERFWTDRGIRGVPAMVFDRKHLVTGAQGVETYTAILRELTAEKVG